MMEKTFADRLREVIGDEDPTPWATTRGISGATIHEWLKKGTAPYPKSMRKLVAATGIPEAWWLRGEGVPPLAARTLPYENGTATKLVTGDGKPTGLTLEDALPAGIEDYVYVPYYDVRASAGHGAFVSDQRATRHFAFDRGWLVQQLGIGPARLALIPVSGRSMEPDLHDGDLVMIDRGDVEVLREGVYVFELDDRLYVKRLSLRGDHLVVASSNGDYPPIELTTLLERPSFRLHGRVLGSPAFKRL